MDAALANAEARQRLQITSLTHLQTIFKSVIKQEKDISSDLTLVFGYSMSCFMYGVKTVFKASRWYSYKGFKIKF